MAREDLSDDIQRVRERMVDDHNELKGEHQSILSAIRTGFRDATTQREAMREKSGGFSNTDHLWKLGYVAAAALSYFLAKVMT